MPRDDDQDALALAARVEKKAKAELTNIAALQAERIEDLERRTARLLHTMQSLRLLADRARAAVLDAAKATDPTTTQLHCSIAEAALVRQAHVAATETCACAPDSGCEFIPPPAKPLPPHPLRRSVGPLVKKPALRVVTGEGGDAA